MIDWTAAPDGTTHATIPSGDPRWYKLADGKVLCWATRLGEWSPSFFLTVDEISETGLCLYANGEQSELVMLREQRDALKSALVGLLDDMRMRARLDGDVDSDGCVVLNCGNSVLLAAKNAIALVEGTK
jgi:hypothetical protein